MFSFKAKDTKLIVTVDTKTNVERSDWLFEFDVKYQASANVMASHLSKVFHDTVERIRKEAYNAGWNDKRNKRRKKKEFFNHFDNDIDVGY